jgi:hypothetical protein
VTGLVVTPTMPAWTAYRETAREELAYRMELYRAAAVGCDHETYRWAVDAVQDVLDYIRTQEVLA